MTPREEAIAEFQKVFQKPPRWVARAPGRVNLIGEHTDYNDGFVLPMAIEYGAWVAFAPRDDRQVRLVAFNVHHQQNQFALDDVLPNKPLARSATERWSNYGRGVGWALQSLGLKLAGFDGVIAGNVPIGAGLSSSAAFELSLALAYQQVSGFTLSKADLALICQKAENDFAGNRCGIMDQFISALGREGHALLIDCRDLSHKLAPLPAGVSVVVCNSMVKRGLVDSEYNARRSECETGVAILAKWHPEIRALRDVSADELQSHADELPENVFRRCRHVVSENQRVLNAVAALERGDLKTMGALMEASHESLRTDYEVSVRELDMLVELAKQSPGYCGARLTGAGFGGCTVNLVKSEDVTAFSDSIRKGYQAVIGKSPEIYVCHAANGASVEAV